MVIMGEPEGNGMINASEIPRDIIIVGGSAGALSGLLGMVQGLPPSLPARVALVLHRAATYETNLRQVLARRAQMPVVEPQDGAPFERGIIYLAPRDRHMLLEDSIVRLGAGPKENFARPAIDPLFRSAAVAYGSRVVGVLLSGFGKDGVDGLIAIKKHGGVSLAQNPREADYPAMPMNAINLDHVDATLRSSEISDVVQVLA